MGERERHRPNSPARSTRDGGSIGAFTTNDSALDSAVASFYKRYQPASLVASVDLPAQRGSDTPTECD